MNSAPIRFLIICALFSSISRVVPAQIKFEDVTEKAGLLEPLKGIAGHCAVFGDTNGDDYPELFVGTFTHFEDSVYNQRGHTTGKEPDKLFINKGIKTYIPRPKFGIKWHYNEASEVALSRVI